MLFHFAAGTHEIQNGAWQDKSHQATAQVVGAPKFVNTGPTEGLVFYDGDYLSLAKNLDEAKKLLHQRAMTVSVCVRLEDTAERCGLVGFLSDSKARQQGWVLGFNRNSFVFGLATAGNDPATSRLTYVPATTKIEKGRWYYVAATYDGQAAPTAESGRPRLTKVM